AEAEPPTFESQLPSSSTHLPATPSKATSMPGGYFDSSNTLNAPAVSTPPGKQIQQITPAAPRRSTRDRQKPDQYGNF
ncbi:Bgt-20051, partial [Blumeria graminis f. sp. tritici]